MAKIVESLKNIGTKIVDSLKNIGTKIVDSLKKNWQLNKGVWQQSYQIF